MQFGMIRLKIVRFIRIYAWKKWKFASNGNINVLVKHLAIALNIKTSMMRIIVKCIHLVVRFQMIRNKIAWNNAIKKTKNLKHTTNYTTLYSRSLKTFS